MFEGTPVVFVPFDVKGKHPELVLVDLRDLVKVSKRHRKELKIAKQEGLVQGYSDSLEDCVGLTDCQECREHLKLLKSK